MANTRHMPEGGQLESDDLSVVEDGVEGYSEDDYTDDAGAVHESVRPALIEGEQVAGFFSRVKWGRVALACIFAFLVLAASLFVWNRWYRFDDVADIQGTWRDINSGATMEVNEFYIKLAEDAVYEYSIDTNAKSIHYFFGGNEGFSSYRFSEDRTQLVLEDGAETDWGLVFHFRDDPGFAEGALEDGLTRLEKVSSEVPSITLPGGNRPAGALVQSKPQSSSASSASSGKIGTQSGSSGASSREGSSSSAPVASQTEPDENGLIVGPDRNAKGYYDSNGIFVPVSYGHFDESGNWVQDSGGYYSSDGVWVEGASGYYDASGTWVNYNAQSEASTGTTDQPDTAAEGTSGYYDQYGNWVDTSAWSEAGEIINAEEVAIEDAYDEGW